MICQVLETENKQLFSSTQRTGRNGYDNAKEMSSTYVIRKWYGIQTFIQYKGTVFYLAFTRAKCP